MVITDLNVGLLFVFALSSLGVYGVALGGWASNSKFALLGGIRGAAQMISYELALGLSLVPVVMLAGSFSLVAIVDAQAGVPFIVLQPVSFAISWSAPWPRASAFPLTCPKRKTNWVPGFIPNTAACVSASFFWVNMFTSRFWGALTAVFFLGGWHGPWLPPVVWLMLKIVAVAVIMIWMRGTLPRLRYDQLMALGWKVLIPASLINIVVTGAFILFAS
jgi:NADH-quinone oxidoreductase subunit H